MSVFDLLAVVVVVEEVVVVAEGRVVDDDGSYLCPWTTSSFAFCRRLLLQAPVLGFSQRIWIYDIDAPYHGCSRFVGL